jgi:hypothetical protein
MNDQLKQDGLMGELFEMYVNHTFYIGANGGPDRHACLQEGVWCFQNFRQHPQDITKYLKRKLK